MRNVSLAVSYYPQYKGPDSKICSSGLNICMLKSSSHADTRAWYRATSYAWNLGNATIAIYENCPHFFKTRISSRDDITMKQEEFLTKCFSIALSTLACCFEIQFGVECFFDKNKSCASYKPRLTLNTNLKQTFKDGSDRPLNITL